MLSKLDLNSINPTMRAGIIRYLMYGVIPGGFLQAIIKNDLVDSSGRADHDNITKLHVYACLIYNHFPKMAWGSEEKMEAWSEARQSIPFGPDRIEFPDGWFRDVDAIWKGKEGG